MKILHTADWHIGKKLHNYELREDFDRFINWLCRCAREENIDALLVSGDCFDLANPSSAARSQYYESLIKLKKHVGQIIITGGNHDSPAMLNAPKDLMKALDLEVIGGLPKNIEETLIPLKNKAGNTEAVVAAIPFLRHPDLRNEGIIKTYEDRLEALRQGIGQIFQQAAECCQQKFPDLPAIAMGHLYTAGIEASESERDIQIGNQAAVRASAFGDYFEYVALGHIHKPQQVSAEQPIFYSGSPIPLSFSEYRDQKRMLVLDTEKNWFPISIPVPSFRGLVKITGTLQHIGEQLTGLPQTQGPENLIEIELREQDYRAKSIYDLEEMVARFECPGYKIVKHRVRFENQAEGLAENVEEQVALEELKPQKVFSELLGNNDLSAEETHELKAAFAEILEEVH